MDKLHKRAANEILRILIQDRKRDKGLFDSVIRDFTPNNRNEYGNAGVFNPILRERFNLSDNDIKLVYKSLKSSGWIVNPDNPVIDTGKIDAAERFLKLGGYDPNLAHKFYKWVVIPDNLWRFIIAIIGAIWAIYLATRK